MIPLRLKVRPVVVLLAFGCMFSHSHTGHPFLSGNPPPGDTIRCMFYNVENLFDIYNDTLTRDDEYAEDGFRNWNNYRFYKKINKIARAIIAVGGWNPPALIGLCEIENRYVLEKLIYNTPLKNVDYGIVHFDSYDNRGIDVALLYRKSKFSLFTVLPVRPVFPDEPERKTRDILYIKGLLCDADTIHLLVNHWPSKYGGYAATQPLRNHIAAMVRTIVDSVLLAQPNANIILMGDFNDGIDSESVLDYLGASVDTCFCRETGLWNLMSPYLTTFNKGTNKYREEWETIDQIIVSSGMLCNGNPLEVAGKRGYIFEAPFLLQKDERYLGWKPFRTYSGAKYLGGFSDHLPVYIDIVLQYPPSGHNSESLHYETDTD